MGVSRRTFLGIVGATVVTTAVDASGVVTPTAAASAADGPTPVGLPGRGLFSGRTTMDQTIARMPTSNAGGYFKLQAAAGESHLIRPEVSGWGYQQPTRALSAFVQITDMQIVDDQSPGRVEFTDRWANLPNAFNPSTSSAYRPQEFLSTHIMESMVRAIRDAGRGPMTGLPFSFTIATGDMVDNVQYNETRWYMDLLDGGRSILADSGQIGLEQSVSGKFGFDDLTPNVIFHESLYWSPEGLTDNFSRVDQYRLKHGFPIVPGLLPAARRSYVSTGLGMPWYAAMGNHDGEIQGNYPVHPTFVVGLKLPDISGRVTSNQKAFTSQIPLPNDPSPGDVADFVESFRNKPVVADPNRRFLTHSEFALEHWNTAGMPRGHGFDANGRTYYTLPSADTDLIQYITIDTVNYDGNANGRVPIDQYRWLESQLRANSSKYIAVDNTIVTQAGVRDKLIVVFAHHTIDSTNNDSTDVIDVGDPDFIYTAGLEALLLRHPNVVLMVAGHTHRNVIESHARGVTTRHGNHVVGIGGFWEISTASHIDWPAQCRTVEIAAGQNVVSIFTTMLDIASPPDAANDTNSPVALASIARELAYNDPTELVKHGQPGDDRLGDLDDRNTQLLVAAPFPITVPVLWGSALALGRNSDGRMELFGAGPDDQVWQRYQPTAGSDTWSGWGVFGGLLKATAIKANFNGTLDLYGVNGGGEVWHRWQILAGGWSDWTSLGVIGARSIAVARNLDGRLEIFVTIGATGDVWHNWQTSANATTWNGWSTGFGALGATPAQSSTLFVRLAAETNTDGRVQVFGLTPNGKLFTRTQISAGGWTGWTALPTPNPLTAIAAGRQDDGRLELVAIDADRRVFENAQAAAGSTAWGDWTALDGGRTRMTQIATERNGAGLLEVFGTDHTGRVWRRRQTAANTRTFTDWTNFDGTVRPDVPAQPAAALRPTRTVRIIQADTGRHLDAHEIADKDYQVVTRPLQTVDQTQLWTLADQGNGVHTITQASNGRRLDAHEIASLDFRVVTRPAQADGTQTWLINEAGGGRFTIRQVSTGQYLDAYETDANDFKVVTRYWKNADEQRWRIVDA